MAQPLNLGVALGASKTGQSVGYRLLNLDGTTQAAFTTTNVSETTVAGTYVVTVPVNVSDNGARIVWGISGTDYAAFTIDPIANVNVYQVSGDSVAADNLEAAADGTGYNLGGGSIVAASVAGNVGGSVASVTAGVSLADNAITAAKIADNAIDAGAIASDAVTEIQSGLATSASIAALNNLSAQQVWEYGTRSLTTFGTLVADVWAYATRTLTNAASEQSSASSGSALTITRSITFSATVTGLAVPGSWTSARWTIKRSKDTPNADDSTALIQVLVSNPSGGGDGLVVLNGGTSSLTANTASLSISGTTATITIADHITAQLAKGVYVYDIKFYYGSSASSIGAAEAPCTVVATPTQTV